MIALGKKLAKGGDGQLLFWCPACDTAHAISLKPGSGWTFDGNAESPTFTPSVLARTGNTVCHSFVVAGRMQFLNDCSHAMKGKTVEIPDWPFECEEKGEATV